MSEIKYADLHCDSVTVCCDLGGNMSDFSGQVNVNKLVEAGCAAQCFAIFTEGKNAAADFDRYAAFYSAFLKDSPQLYPVLGQGDLERAQGAGKPGGVLTVENLGFLHGDLDGIDRLKKMGVRMASLVWNYANEFAYPNLIFNGDTPDFAAREQRGLTERGKEAVQALSQNGIITDVSHLSDGGVRDVLALSTLPVVASHSNCAAVHPVSRNLTDWQIRGIAESGGLVGLNFCRDFVGGESVFENLYLHFMHLLEVGGEDLPAIGSDFDGIPPYGELKDCRGVQSLLTYFSDRGVKPRLLEKLAYLNFKRVFG